MSLGQVKDTQRDSLGVKQTNVKPYTRTLRVPVHYAYEKAQDESNETVPVKEVEKESKADENAGYENILVEHNMAE